MKARTILFAAGLLATAFQSSAQITTVVGSTKIPLKLQITKQSPYCHGDQNGTILIDIIGGQAPYFVNDQMINGSSFQMANLSAGSYRIEVADDAVSYAAADVVLVDPAAVQVSSIVNNVSTYHGSNGKPQAKPYLCMGRKQQQPDCFTRRSIRIKCRHLWR